MVLSSPFWTQAYKSESIPCLEISLPSQPQFCDKEHKALCWEQETGSSAIEKAQPVTPTDYLNHPSWFLLDMWVGFDDICLLLFGLLEASPEGKGHFALPETF